MTPNAIKNSVSGIWNRRKMNSAKYPTNSIIPMVNKLIELISTYNERSAPF